MTRVIFSFFTALFLTACQTEGYFITENPLTVPEIRKVVNAVTGKPRQVSINGRELISEYHNRKFEPFDPAGKDPNRYSTKVVILGPRRPYEINVLVLVDQFDLETGVFVNTHVDEGLSRLRAGSINRALNLSLARKTGFDGETPF